MVAQVCSACHQSFQWLTPAGPPRCRSCWQAHCRGLATRGLLQAVPFHPQGQVAQAVRPALHHGLGQLQPVQLQLHPFCPDCGCPLQPSGGCLFCQHCGYSAC